MQWDHALDYLTISEWREYYAIETIGDCHCVAEEVAAGFVELDDPQQLELFPIHTVLIMTH